MSEIMKERQEFERNNFREVERKFIPVFPERLKPLMYEASTVQQYYLSHPREDFSLRMRETTEPGAARTYVATLKDRGVITSDGIDRLEVEIPIERETYEYYKANMPLLHKFRATPVEGVAIDFFSGGYTQCEAESAEGWNHFVDEYGPGFVEVTGDASSNNEWLAHMNYRRHHEGQEALVPSEDLDVSAITSSIIECLARQNMAIVRVAGRSGSGKSTILRDIETSLQEKGTRSITLSTDDYHRGKRWLEEYKGDKWTEWDAPIVYDVAALAEDIRLLQKGESIKKRWFDFATEEPASGDFIAPQPVILIEGIYAGSQALEAVSDLAYEMPTPFATCVGRRLLRDMRERPQFADPEKSLRYILEQAEPAYRNQSR